MGNDRTGGRVDPIPTLSVGSGSGTRGTLDNLGVALIVVPVRILLQTVPHVVGVEKDGEDNDATGQTNHNRRSSVGPRRCRAFGVLVLR